MKRLSSWSTVLVWCGVIFAFSSIPGQGERELDWTLIAKTAHFVEYFVLSVLLSRALEAEGVSPRRAAAAAFVLSALYGVSDEWHQSFTPGRSPCATDVLIDGAGALTAAVVRVIL